MYKFVSTQYHNDASCKILMSFHFCTDFQLPVQSVPITTNDVSSYPVHGEVYSIQQYVIKFVSDLWCFFPGSPVFSTNKIDRHNITEILLKVALNTINQPTISVHKWIIVTDR